MAQLLGWLIYQSQTVYFTNWFCVTVYSTESTLKFGGERGGGKQGGIHKYFYCITFEITPSKFNKSLHNMQLVTSANTPPGEVQYNF